MILYYHVHTITENEDVELEFSKIRMFFKRNSIAFRDKKRLIYVVLKVSKEGSVFYDYLSVTRYDVKYLHIFHLNTKYLYFFLWGGGDNEVI